MLKLKRSFFIKAVSATSSVTLAVVLTFLSAGVSEATVSTISGNVNTNGSWALGAGTATGTSATADVATATTSEAPSRSVGRKLVESAGPGSGVGVAACPSPGQRVKHANDARIFLREPSGEYYLIPNQTVYFRLWDSFSGVVVNNDVFNCINSWGGYYELNNAYLAKTASDPRVYIYDSTFPGYRWIVNASVFNKYGFSWGKIGTISSPTPRSPDWT